MGEDMAGGGEGRGYSAAGLIYREGYGRSWAAPEDGPSTQGPPRPPGWRRTQRNRRRHKRRFKSPSPPTAIASSRLPPPAPPVPRLAPRSARSLCHGSYRRSSTASSHNEPRHHNLDFVHMPQLLFTASMGHLSHSAAPHIHGALSTLLGAFLGPSALPQAPQGLPQSRPLHRPGAAPFCASMSAFWSHSLCPACQ